MNLSKLAVSKPTTIVLIFIILTALGIYSTLSLPIDLFPEMDLPYIAVITTYENAGPEEVERSITRPIESAVSSVTGIDNLFSTSSQGTSFVGLELLFGTNLDSAANEMRDRIDMIKGFLPEGIDPPMILKMDPAMIPIMNLSVTGSRTPEELRQITEDIIQPKIEQIDGVASVGISGGREKAILIDISRDRLEAYSLTVTQIAQMIGAQNIQAAGGIISEGDLNYTISTSGEFTSVEDIKNSVISYKVQGPEALGQAPSVKSIKLRDIADVYEGYKKESSLAYLNGIPGVMLSIQKQSGKNSVATADAVTERLAEIEKDLPKDIQIIEISNTTNIIKDSISNVTSSAVQGAILAIIVLFIFLRSLKSTLIIGITIPISLIITLGVMYFTGFTLNIMTLAGLALGVGMLVDNSIVILENIYSYRERGTKAAVAAVLGSQEMLMAITASTLTTICVFLPLIMYKQKLGIMGQLFEGLTFTVVFSLLCSLIVAIILVPVLASKYFKLESLQNRNYKGILGWIDRGMARFFDRLDTAYGNAVRWVLYHKFLFLFVLIVMFGASIFMAFKIGFVNMPTQESDTVAIDVTMPQGTRLEVTEEVLHRLEAIARNEIDGFERMAISVGSAGAFDSIFGSSTNTGRLEIALPDFKNRRDTDEVVKTKMRRHFEDFPGASFAFASSVMGGVGGSSGIDVIIKSEDLNLARSTAEAVKAALEKQAAEYVTEPQMDLTDGLPQVNIVIDRERLYNLGLNIYSVSNEIKANINGQLAGRYRDGGNEIDIVVSLDESDREKLNDLEQIFVTNSSGSRIPLSSFAAYQEGTSPVSINRENQARTVHVTAATLPKLSLDRVQAHIERVIQASVPHDEQVTIEFGGDFETFQENIIQFAIIILMAVVLVFAVMASQFESFLDPFIVLFTIPLSVIGIVIVYLIMGDPFNTITAVGLLVLVGVIVNNGIVLVDYTNLLRKRGRPLREACIEAAKNRLRPILMTTLTTVLGLIPMAFFPGEGSSSVQPVGQTVFGGLTFGTLMTLFLMPTLYYIFNRFREKRKERKARKLARSKRAALEDHTSVAREDDSWKYAAWSDDVPDGGSDGSETGEEEY